MKGYELSMKESEPSFLPAQVSVTEMGGGGFWGRFRVEDWGGRVTGVT